MFIIGQRCCACCWYIIGYSRDAPNRTCEEQYDFYSILETNSTVVAENGLKSLPQAIYVSQKLCTEEESKMFQFAEELRTTKCCAPCQASPQLKVTVGEYLLIDTDYIGSDLPSASSIKSCKIEDIPISINVFGKHFRLVGFAAHTYRHYKAYVRDLASGRWSLHDDVSRAIVANVSTAEEVRPHILLFAQ